MTACVMPEVIISSHSAKKSNWSMDDVHTGNVLLSAKSGESSAKTLCLVGRDYLVSAVPESPVINVWPLAQPKHAKKMVVPGCVTALAVSRQGLYLVAAIENKLHLWQVSTGNLLRVLHGHYQEVKCIKFTNDGSHFISGGEDAKTLVWRVSSVLSSEIINSKDCKTNDVIKPSFTWNNHSLGVTDIHVGYFGCKARIATVSKDQTCKLYHLPTGRLILSVCMDVGLLCVSMDPAERFVFLGADNGNIYCVTLAYCVTSAYCDSSREIHYDPSNEKLFKVFSGHSKNVTCLSVSMDGQTLLSGSDDCSLRLWSTISQTCEKIMQCEGPITNAFLAMTPPVVKNFNNKNYKVPVFEFETLKRHLHRDDESADEDGAFKNPMIVNLRNQQLRTWDLSCGIDILEGITSAGESDNSKAQLKEDIGSIKKTNEQMYYYLVDSFISTIKK